MTDTTFGIAADLKLRTSPWVTSVREAEQSTKSFRAEAMSLDQVVNNQLRPHMDMLSGLMGTVRRETDLARQSLYGYEDAARRSATATDRLVASQRAARNGGGFNAGSLGQNAIGMGVSESIGGGFAGSVVGSGAMQLVSKIPVVGQIAALTALTAVVGDAALGMIGFNDAADAQAEELTELIDSTKKYNDQLLHLSFVRQAAEQANREAQMGLSLAESIASRADVAEQEARAVLTAKQKETQGLQAELAAQMKAEQVHAVALAALRAGQAANGPNTGAAQFGMAVAAAPGQRESLTFQRVSALATEARAAQSGGDQESARAKFAEAQALLEQLYAALGNPLDRLTEFQQAIASLGAEINQSFVASLMAETAAHQAARDSAAELAPKVAEAASQLVILTASVQALATAAAAANRELAASQATAVAAQNDVNLAPTTPPGFASGGRNRDPRDNILALLRKGETVLTPEHSQKLAPYLAAAGVPGFADGGFASAIQGTRNYSMVAAGAGLADSQALTAGFREQVNDLMSLGMTYQQAQAVVQRRRAAGLGPVFPGYQQAPSVAASMTGNSGLPGFANGGAVGGGSQGVHVDSINIDYRSQGGTERDARALIREMRTQIARGSASLG